MRLVNSMVVEYILHSFIVLGMVLMSTTIAMTRTQSPVELLSVAILTVVSYIALQCGIMKTRQFKMQQDIDELEELIKKEQQ